MNRAPIRRSMLPSVGAIAALLFASGGVGAAPPPAHRFIGTYTVTQVGGSGVQHMELQLRPDGQASLRTDFSRYTQRPVAAAPVPPVVEKGTWRERQGQAVVHIMSTSSDDTNAAADQRPQYADLTFVLSGCFLRLVGNPSDHGLEFSKKHCAPAA